MDTYKFISIMYGPTESIESSDHFKLFRFELCYNMLVKYVAAKPPSWHWSYLRSPGMTDRVANPNQKTIFSHCINNRILCSI